MSEPITTVWTNPGCGPCIVTKKALEKRGVPFIVKNLAEHPDAVASFKARGLMSAPIVEPFTGAAWSGYDLNRINTLQARHNAYRAARSHLTTMLEMDAYLELHGIPEAPQAA